ncbi:MAG TPA: DUF2007 domain-containing protein [Planctomycetota bacterium]|nr:DUF2007 domain-containing protein [Planctomycetota bacterium]
MLVTVTRCWTVADAEATRGLLLAEGIPAVLADKHMNTVDPISSALGWIRVDVPPEFLEAAQALLAARTRPKSETDEDACPACGKPLPEGDSACAACGWTLAGDDEE